MLMEQLFAVENDTFNFTGDVEDSSIVGGFGADSLVVTDFARQHCLWRISG